MRRFVLRAAAPEAGAFRFLLRPAAAAVLFVLAAPDDFLGFLFRSFRAHSTVSSVFHWIVSVADNELEPQYFHGLWVGGCLKTELEERLHDMRRVVWDSVAQANRSGVPPSIRPYFGGLLGVVKNRCSYCGIAGTSKAAPKQLHRAPPHDVFRRGQDHGAVR